MTDRIAVVTGGSLGLGREVARCLLADGYKVAIFGRGQASLDEAVAELGGDALAVSVDVADNDSVIAGFAAVDRALGPVSVLVNNAALYRPFGIEDATPEAVQQLVNINYCGPVYCMREAVKRMRAHGAGGDIVNVSSESVRQSTPFFSVYTSTKAALETMTRIIGEELREEGIRLMLFRVGRMHSHGAASMPVPESLLPRFIERCTAEGASHWTGAGMAPASPAQALAALLRTPRDARVELVEVRSH